MPIVVVKTDLRIWYFKNEVISGFKIPEDGYYRWKLGKLIRYERD